MYGIFPYIWLIFMVNVGNYTYMDGMGIESQKVQSTKQKINLPGDSAGDLLGMANFGTSNDWGSSLVTN